MRSIIEETLFEARNQGRSTFMPFLTAGFPNPSTCVEILVALAANGAGVIEVGLPFSDPVADGPTIQWANRQALDNGMTPAEVFRIVADARRQLSCPTVLMTYFNPLLRMGPKEFAVRAGDAGVAGVIVPDLPPEEADEWLAAAEDAGLDTIFLVAPNTPRQRLKRVMEKTSGFLYYVSTTGVTGSRFALSPEILAEVEHTRSVSTVPVAVGFGISTAEQARVVARAADGVIVGSALIKELQTVSSSAGQVAAASRFAVSLTKARETVGGVDTKRRTNEGP
ncbi:MAG: tryptophan synthase subunit alpha [Deltaproteobacteria bacterium]